MATSGQDSSQWLSVTEETLFLHDGLLRVTDLVELPHDVNRIPEPDHEVVTFDSKSPSELSERLLTVCGTQNNAYARLLEYRMNALRGLWTAQHQLILEDQAERESATQEETIAMLRKQGLWKDPEHSSFSTRMSLLLVLPLLQSQSRLDPALCGVTAQLLLNCLRDCPPLSLTKEPMDCLNGLENLLCSWLGPVSDKDQKDSHPMKDAVQRQNAASALVALTCARGHEKTFIHTIHLLQSLHDLGSLPVADILTSLSEVVSGQRQLSCVQGNKHLVCWGVEDMLTMPDKDAPNEKDKDKAAELDIGRSICCDGKFLYTTNMYGRGLSKIGTGLHGTLRGYVYARNLDIPAGHVAWGDGKLLHRCVDYDKETEATNMAQILDQYTLQPVKVLVRPEQYSCICAVTTVSFSSDGTYFYWLWCTGSPTDKPIKGHSLFLDVFSVNEREIVVEPIKPRVILQRKEEGTAKTINETLLSRLRPNRSGASAATLAALTSSEAQANRKEETSGKANTSCGMTLKALLKAPIYCDGTTVVILSPPPGGNTSNAARSLFGSGTALSSLRSLATNTCFNVSDGLYNNKSDVTDSPTCALARGTAVTSLGICYDLVNNCIWTCCSDWVDQYHNPGHLARHHIRRALASRYDDNLTVSQDQQVSVSQVIGRLVHHIGSMSLHQLHELHQTPLAGFVLHSQSLDPDYLQRVCDILDKAVSNRHEETILCTLIILQLIFKVSSFKQDQQREKDLISRANSLIWKLLKICDRCEFEHTARILEEACRTVSAGLHVMYVAPDDRNLLLHKLLTEGEAVPSLKHLRDLILIDFAEQYETLDERDLDKLRFTDELLHVLFKLTVRESCQLLQDCHTEDPKQFEQLLSTLPVASPCLDYLKSLQSSLLRSIVLNKQSGATLTNQSKQSDDETKHKLEILQKELLNVAQQVFTGAYEVLEVLLETCNTIINSQTGDMEYRLQGLERISKSTILGHLLPVLMTALTHHHMGCLQIADALMPQLVQLVVLTSQAALLLKSHVQVIGDDDLFDLGTDKDIVELIGEAINIESLELGEKEENGFLAGLKIPAPWATGKSIETIHPVRDNYKFKETVSIPGARCLYLRFDPRCSSQYDYDKVVLYAGPNTSSRKVAEYGGNTLGYGSRSVLGAGWPKDLVKVEGETVTLSFEMRSGREHNTPDKAMWGFLITVRAQESTEEVSNGLPFLADLALGLSVLSCTMLHLLYQGPQISRDELACKHLLKSKLLHRCVWQAGIRTKVRPLSRKSPAQLPIHEDMELTILSPQSPKFLPRVKLPTEIVQKLRNMAERKRPQLRPSIREVIQPDIIEESIVSAAIKHLSLLDTVHMLGDHIQHQTPEYTLLSTIMSEAFRRIDSLIRQLQNLAELEQRWQTEVDDLKQGTPLPEGAFFHDYHLVENKSKELAFLCFLKGLELDPLKLDEAVNNLREKLDAEAGTELKPGEKAQSMCKTRALVSGILERLNLLLHVTISPQDGSTSAITRSTSHMVDIQSKVPSVMVRSDTDIFKSTPAFLRSRSAPMEREHTQDDSIIDITRLQRKRQAAKKAPACMLQDLVTDESHDQPPHVILLEQLFSFIGSNPEHVVSCESFLSAAQVRYKRSNTRKQALVHMKELLTAASRVGGVTHLVAAVTSVLQHGPRIEELTCGGGADQVREAFAETMTSVVQLAARYPIACCNSIGLLCVVPYTRSEEKCLVRCGLVHLLDQLCSLSNHRGDASNMDAQSTRQRVSAMAWAGFQVLSNRCVMWEQEDPSHAENLEHSGLARQVSTLLTNHLARATESSGNEAAGSEALQEVLSLLNNLSRSHMGKAILSQPGCVSKLLSLLLDQRPSPKLVLIILQLCRVALPLMSADDCDLIDLPTWGADLQATVSMTTSTNADKPFKIASLLLAKLGDFLVPGGHTTLSSRRPSLESASGLGSGVGSDKEKEDTDIQDGRLAVFIYKRQDQSSHEVIQPLLSGSSESRPFRLGGGANMEKVVRMDREMTKHNRAEVCTEDAVSALRKAAKWAQSGLVVSTGPPVDSTSAEVSSSGDKKKTATEVVCREKNAELARTDPVRPFISGQVANSMAAEVIALLHSLLTAPETLAAHTWATAVEQVISSALAGLPILVNSLEELAQLRSNQDSLMSMAKLADAALAALGGFNETIKPGCQVQITVDGAPTSKGQVLSLSEQTGLATVQLLPSSDEYQPSRYSDTVQVPLSRLRPPSTQPLPLHQLSMTESIVMAVQAVLLPQDGAGSPLMHSLPSCGDGGSMTNQIARVVAEIRTRACQVLASHLKDITFASAFIQHSSAAIDILKSLAKDCSSGERVSVIQGQVERLQMLYRDCAKPPPPPSKLPTKPAQEILWECSRTFPPVRACLFSHSLTGVTFLGNPSAGSGFPRGTLVYSNQAVPMQAPSFYWELEICSYGDSLEDSSPNLSFGFMPAAEKKDGAWTNPVGTCLIHNNGRAFHYNGSSLLQWKSVRLEVTLNAGDVAGIGWERQGDDTQPLPGQQVKGQVYFTYNGERLAATLDDVSGGMWPVVHIQKKNTRIKANFGARPFAYADGQHHRNAADEYHDATSEIRESFSALPFNLGSDSDSEGTTTTSTVSTVESRELITPPGPPCRTAGTPRSLKEYNVEASGLYKLLPCYEICLSTGPDTRTQLANQDDESDVDDTEEDPPSEDHYALLVKAWEQKVFPTIRRRFRNEAERKDGLEQIRGALQLGMTDIARQTVEFLYEENGGMPRDLQLPTIEDIREDLAKFTIERVRKGTMVLIRTLPGSSPAGTTVLPKYAVRGMLKTFSLPGIVLDVDQSNELVQVETYLRSEGVLVRFWYPLHMLERPPQGYRRSSIIGQQVLDTSSIHLHRELLRCESLLARMFCRTALLELITQCNSPAMDVPSCSTNLSTAMAASAALLQELDVENLQLLANELLAAPQPHGSLIATSLLTTHSPQYCLAAHSASATDVFYHDSSQLKQELLVAIARAANQGEDYLIELSNQICTCLQTSPEMFPYEEIPVTENKVSMDLFFPGAAFLVVSCKAEPKATKRDTSLYKSPWARFYTYRGSRVKRTGQWSKQEVISYPRDTSSSSNQSHQYGPVIIPAEKIHIRVGVSPTPGVTVTIHALPPQFPLAVTYIETLISQCYNFEHRRPEDEPVIKKESKKPPANKCTPEGVTSPWRTFDSVIIPPGVLMHVAELIGGYLWRSDIPAVIKEYVLHLFAQCLRMLHLSQGHTTIDLFGASPPFTPSFTLLMQLQSELRRLYEEETKAWPSVSTVSGSGVGLGVGDQGRFSSYFQSLLEVSLAVAEVTSPITAMSLNGSFMTDSKPSDGASVNVPTSPVSTGKRKKLKAKRDRDRSSSITSVRRNGSPRRSSESRSGASSSASMSSTSVSASESGGDVHSSSSSSSSITSSKPEDMLWFHRALTMSQILRFLTYGEVQGQGVTYDAVSDASQTLVGSTVHTRLLVISGIPCDLSEKTVESALRKACNSCGGLFKDEIFIPTQEVEIKADEMTADKQVEQDRNIEAEIQEAAEDIGESSNASPQLPESTKIVKKHILTGHAVIELRSKTKLDNARKAIYKSKSLIEGEHYDPDQLVEIPEEMLCVSVVNQSLFADPQGNAGLEHFLHYKLCGNHDNDLSDLALIALTEIFHSCFITEQRLCLTDSLQDSGYICLDKEQIMSSSMGNLLFTFFSNVRAPKKTLSEQVLQVLRRYGVPKLCDKEEADNGKEKPQKKTPKPSPKEKVALVVREKKTRVKEDEEKCAEKDLKETDLSPKTSREVVAKEEERLLTLEGFLQYVVDKAQQDVRAVWRALLACGFDLHFDRCTILDQAQAHQMSGQWSLDMDAAVVLYINNLCRHLAVSPARLHPHEVYLSEAELSSSNYSCLQGVPVESIRLRFALLQSLNNSIETFFLPLIDLRPSVGSIFSRSIAHLLMNARGLMFYDAKIVLLNRILNATAQRKADQAAPEIALDPLEKVSGEKNAPVDTNLCQALRQLSGISSSQLCVRLAAGGDPTYAFNVRMLGEEVHGTSGSFRHFLWQVARELESDILDLFIPTPSAVSQKNKGKYILKPGPMTFSEERLLVFIGQLLAITVRADIPFGLDLSPVFWKNLVGCDLDPVTDLQDTDILTYNYIKKFEMAEDESELHALCADTYPRFTYITLTGEERELVQNGRCTLVSWENRHQYIEAVHELRMTELRCHNRTSALRAGMASILPVQFLPLLSPLDAEMRVCGQPFVDLDFLKAHTMYQVGLMEADVHIQYFWSALESLTQEQLCRFIKFACNQERIPHTCPCRDGGSDTAHVPPFPMKIAPPDGPGLPDSRYIRVETCMFMIKLPQYSCQSIMTERLLYAIHMREDPLSG